MSKGKTATTVVLINMLALSGCVLNKPNNIVDQEKDVVFFVQTATRIVLHETKPTIEDIEILKRYLIASQDLIGEDKVDFNDLKELIEYMLPNEYHVFALTITDVIQRYVDSHLSTEDNNDVKRNSLIKAGLNGAIIAINEYVENNNE